MPVKPKPPSKQSGETEEQKGVSVPLFNRAHYRHEKQSALTAISRTASIVLFVIFCAVVLGALALFWIFREDISRDSIRRITSSITQRFQSHAVLSADIITFDSQPENMLAPFLDGLAVLTRNRLVCYDAIGGERLAAERSFKTPALQISSRNVLAYDRGGTTLLFANRSEFLLDTQWEKPIITARLNKNGWAALVTQGSGYKSVVTVFNPDGDVAVRYSSPYYITDAALSPDAKLLAVACVGFSDNWISSQLRVFDLGIDDADAIRETAAVTDLGDDMITELFFPKNNRISAVTEKGVIFCDEKGVQLGQTMLSGRKLLDYSGLDGALALRTAKNHAGAGSRLELFDWDGKAVGGFEIDYDVVCQSGGGNYVTLVTADRIIVYDDKLSRVSDQPNETHVRNVLQCDSGSMFFIYNDTARLYTP